MGIGFKGFVFVAFAVLEVVFVAFVLNMTQCIPKVSPKS